MKVNEAVNFAEEPGTVAAFLSMLSFVLSGLLGIIFRSHDLFGILLCVSIPIAIAAGLVLGVCYTLQKTVKVGPDHGKKYIQVVDRVDLVKTLTLCIFWPVWLGLAICKGIKLAVEPVIETFKTIVEFKGDDEVSNQ